MTEGSKSYEWLGSQAHVECSGCSKLRREVDELRSILMTTSVHPRDDNVQCNSTYISERKQTEIDNLLMEARHKAEAFQEAYEKTLQEKRQLLDANSELKKQLNEKVNEVAVLKQQNAVYVADFNLERQDRERSQSRLTELEEQLSAATQRIAELEDDRQHLLTTVTTTRHQNPPISVYRGHVMEPAVPYPEDHLPSYSVVSQPVVTHHSRHLPRSSGYDVCDCSANDSCVANVQ